MFAMRLYVETRHVHARPSPRKPTDIGDSVRWQATFEKNLNISDLRAAVRDTTENGPTEKGLRSICWKVKEPSSLSRSCA